jgi:hypothetical protein
LGTPRGVADAALAAREHGVNGFVPSMEAFSYVTQHIEGGEPWLVGKRRKPWGLEVSGEGKMPYRNLMARVSRFAVSKFSQNPQLDFREFEKEMGRHFFGSPEKTQAVADLLAMQRIWTHDTDWYFSSPLLDPEFFRARANRLKWSQKKLEDYDKALEQLAHISKSYRESTNPVELEMALLAQAVVNTWATGRKPSTTMVQAP